MMIYVFYVNRGDMLTFDSCLAVESVGRLQEDIYKDTSIPVENQVLLMSGGESMSPEARVASYSAGMVETCPIFLFNTKAIEEKYPPPIVVFDFGEFDYVRQKVEGCYDMAPTLATLSTRTQLAMGLRDQSKKYETKCKALVLDQHRQHQGWCTVVANLEDSLKAVAEKTEGFVVRYEQFLRIKAQQMEMLDRFPESFDLLSRTPILASLREVLSKPQFQSRFLDGLVPETLIQFLTTLDNNQDLLGEAERSIAELSQINADQLARVVAEQDEVFDKANLLNLKEVGGLERRLYTLEQLLVNIDRIVKDQTEFAQGFHHNLKRCREVADPNVLPDLCNSHKAQLRQMLQRDMELRNILLKCLGTKRELCDNLHMRLRWIMFVENKLAALEGRIALQYENCKRLKIRIDMLDQIHRAPQVYAQLCVEVCRRRNSSISYSVWSDSVYEKSKEWYDKEVEHRKEFYRLIGPHFLKEFFPKLDRLPRPIMPSPVRQVDEDLPPITQEEINSLKEKLPELEQCFRLNEDKLTIQVSPTLQSIGHSPLSPATTEPPGTPSDIAILTPRTNQSSQGSVDVSKVLSPTVSATGQTAHHSELSESLEILSEKLELNEDIFKTACGTPLNFPIGGLAELLPVHSLPGSDVSENILDAEGFPDYHDHMMARFEQLHLDSEDISSATDDDVAPASWAEDNGAFLTANFYLSDELESVSGARGISTEMANTITIQNSEIEKLLSDKSLYKRKCDNLGNLIQHLAKTFQHKLQNLKEKSALVRKDLHSQQRDYDTFQTSILTAMQTMPAMQQIAVDKALAGCKQTYDSQISTFNATIKQMKLENCELLTTIDSLNFKNDELSSQITEAAANQSAEILSAVKLSESEIIRRLTLEHELELDEIKTDSTSEISLIRGEVAEREAEISQLKSDIETLHEQRTADSTLSTQQMEEYKAKADSTLEERLAEVTASHKLEKTTLNEEFKRRLKGAMSEKETERDTHVAELKAGFELQIQALIKPTTERSVNTDGHYLSDHLEKLRAELQAENLKTLADKTEQLEHKFQEQLKIQEEYFLEQSKQLKQSHEQELEYRATTMKDSLEQVSEMKSEQKFVKMKREKDSVIAELKRQLKSIRGTSPQLDFELHSMSTSASPLLTASASDPHPLTASQSTAASASAMAESVVALDMSSENHGLEEQLTEKNNLIRTLQSQVNTFQMSASSQDMLQNDKISVKSCRVGDKVILCYDEEREHYIVFTLSAMLHFVHTDCIRGMDLERPDGRKRAWVLAEVLSKELCQTRKTENRFKLPVNTKFFRVRTKQWDIQ